MTSTSTIYRTIRRPRVGMLVSAATGEEMVTSVADHGRILTTVDAVGRSWRRVRSADGAWSVR